MQTVYVCGHRNPDMDSIGSAIAYAELRTQLDPDTKYLPVRLGKLNPQTRWVLGRAGIDEPEYLAHIRPRAGDAMRTRFARVAASDPIREAALAIVAGECDLVPVLGAAGTLAGAITTRGLARRYVSAAHPDAGAGPDSLDAPCSELMEEIETLCAGDGLLSDAAAQIRDSHSGAAVVTDDDNRPIGLLTRADLVSPPHRRVLLVDHAELAQAVPGIEQAEIVEILDHHNIGSIQTRLPVRATFDPVGSTATLVSERFADAGIAPSRASATVLLGAVLSDTVILGSPTTTERDAAAVKRLGAILAVDPEAFGREMFRVGSDVADVSAEELVRRDAKAYRSGSGTAFLVAQVEVAGKGLLERREELLEAMRREREAREVALYALMVTDILDRGTELLIAGDVGAVARAFGVQPNDGVSLTLPGVMSRKKQVAPPLLEAL